jgi:hypothetical protein
MNDSATITGNTADLDDPRVSLGGGIWSYRGTLRGVTCAPHANANVFDNSPDDCDL